MGLGAAQRQINVIRQAVDQETKRGARIDYVRGQIAATYGNYADVYLDGNEVEASEEFRVPANIYVNVGDWVICAIDYGSNLGKWINEVLPTDTYAKLALNPNTGEVYTSDGTSTPVPGSIGSGGGGRRFPFFMG
jgi:hypothetical protein